MKDLFNIATTFALKGANLILEQFAFNIPSEVMGIFEIKFLELKFYDGYIQAGLTPTFIPIPKNKTFQQVVSEMIAEFHKKGVEQVEIY